MLAEKQNSDVSGLLEPDSASSSTTTTAAVVINNNTIENSNNNKRVPSPHLLKDGGGGAKSSGYEYIQSLSDIQSISDLNDQSIRDILRRKTSNPSLEVVRLGPIESMDGTNDAFNSSLARLNVVTTTSSSGDESESITTYNFIIKSPPKMTFIQMIHKLTQPFFHESFFYTQLAPQLHYINGGEVIKGIGDGNHVSCQCMTIDHLLPLCFHAYSRQQQYMLEYEETKSHPRGQGSSGQGGGAGCFWSCRKPDSKLPWWCSIICRQPELGVLVLENMSQSVSTGKQYKMFDKRSPLPLDHMTRIMIELAHFHGKWLTWINRAKHNSIPQLDSNSGDGSANMPPPLSFQKFRKTCNSQRKIPMVLAKRLKNVALQAILKILRKRNGPNDIEYGRRCEHYFNHKSMQRLKEYLAKCPEDEPVNTLIHGDFWSNNILFSYKRDDKTDEEIVDDVVLIDFQLINYGHPCYDLVYLIYLNTDLQFRDAHLGDMLKLYHSTFQPYVEAAINHSNITTTNTTSHVQSQQLSATEKMGKVVKPPPFQYSFQQFIQDYEYHRPLGITTACAVMPNVFSSVQLDLEKTGLAGLREMERKQQLELDDDSNECAKEIRRRIQQIVDEAVRDNIV